jgi:hypothetical protein
MTQLRVSVRFCVRGVWVHPGALGRTYAWHLDGRAVTLALPGAPDDLTNPDEPEVPVIPAWTPTAVIQGSGDAVSIQLVAVDVAVEGPVSAAEKEASGIGTGSAADERADGFARVAQQLFTVGYETAERAALDWLAHVRVASGQPWLGLAVEKPAQYGRGHIFDADAGVRLMSFGPTQRATMRSGQLAVSVALLDEIHRKVASSHEPEVAESLLADARFLVQEAETLDAQRGVLIAAVACEIKAKATMRAKVEPSRAELLSFVLARISNLQQLLDAPIRGALGSSLKEDDPELYDHVSRLGTLRNRIVHRGETVAENEAYRLVVAASQLFVWLDGLGVEAAPRTGST